MKTKKYSDTITVRQKSMEIFRLSKWGLCLLTLSKGLFFKAEVLKL